MKTNQCLSREQLFDLLDGEGADSESFEQHLESCTACRETLEGLAGEPQVWREVRSQLSTLDALGLSSSGFGDTGSLSNASTPRAARKPFSSQFLDPPSHPEMLGRIGRYDIESVIGQGGFGVVFKGYDTELNRPVAIKVLSPHLASSGVARRRFAREAQAAAAVSHPNVVPIHAVDSNAELPYLVMTFVPGHSLQALVAKYGPLDTISLVRIGQQVAAGLSAAHRQGLVHRDIKPANILLENDLSRAMLTDFGLARAADDAAATQTGWLAGTPHYMSPEQASGRDIDRRSDLFSLGSVLYFLATGREPFRGESPLAVLRMIGNHQPLSAFRVNSDIPRTLSDLIDRLLEKNPENRIQSASELEALLEQYLAHLQHPQTQRAPRLGWSRKARQRLTWGAAMSLLLAGTVTLWGFLPPSQPAQTEREPASNQSLTWVESMAALREEQQFDTSLNQLGHDVVKVERILLTPPPMPPSLTDGEWEYEINAIHQQLNRLDAALRD